MKKLFLSFLCLTLSFISIPFSASAQSEALNKNIVTESNTEFFFGHEPLPLPKYSELRRVFSEFHADQSYLQQINPEDAELKQVATLLSNLFQSSDTIIYQVLIPADTGYQQAFLITVQMPKDNFIKSQWSALFPDPDPNTLLGIYQNEFLNKLAKTNGQSISLSIGSQENFSLLRLTEPMQLGTRNHSLVSSHSASFVAELSKFSFPVYYRQWGWTNNDDYYMVLLVSLDGEREFWETYSSKHFFLPFITM